MPSGAELAERMMTAFGAREVWAQRTVDHITAIVQAPNGEGFLIDIWTRWDKPQTISWVRYRTREQIRVWDGTQGWTATREYGQPAEVRDWSAQRVAQEVTAYRAQFERLIHRIAGRDSTLSFAVATGEYEGWLEARERGEPVTRLQLRPNGEPEKVLLVGTGDAPIIFSPLVSFGDHKQPASGIGGGGLGFTTYLAELLPTAAGIHFGRPKNLMNLDPRQ